MEFIRYMKRELVKGINSGHFVGRLMLLIKNPDKPPSIGNLRPITISSNIVKIYEKIIENRCKEAMVQNIIAD